MKMISADKKLIFFYTHAGSSLLTESLHVFYFRASCQIKAVSYFWKTSFLDEFLKNSFFYFCNALNSFTCS